MSLFVAVADSSSFAEAARRFDISPPAVTRVIAALEERLATRLLHRTTRRVKLTEPGACYLADCKRILADLAEAESAVACLQAAPRGLLSVTAPVLFGQMFVLPALLEFLDLYPAVQARTLFLDRVVNLLEEGVDVALRIGELADSSLIAVKVGQVRRVCCASPSYLERAGTPLAPEDLDQHRLVAAGSFASPRGWHFGSDGPDSRIEIESSLTVNTNPAAIRAAVYGWGITRVLSYQISSEVASGALAIVLQEFEPAPWPVYILHQEGRKVSAKVRAFVDLLAQRLRASQDLL